MGPSLRSLYVVMRPVSFPLNGDSFSSRIFAFPFCVSFARPQVPTIARSLLRSIVQSGSPIQMEKQNLVSELESSVPATHKTTCRCFI
ncbi:hypothetical protein EJB05_39699, partial [Eragrostis curvula]